MVSDLRHDLYWVNQRMKYMRHSAVAAGPKIRSKYELDGIIEVWYMVYGIIEVCQYNVKCIMYNKIRSKYSTPWYN